MSQPAVPPSYGERQALSLDTILEQVSGSGWSFFERQNPADFRGSWQEDVVDRADGAAKAAAAIFDTPQGRELLEHLADITVRRPNFVLGLPDPATYGALREGQNLVFYSLVRLIAIGRGERPPVREGT